MLGWRSRTRGGRDVAAAPRPDREVSRALPPVAYLRRLGHDGLSLPVAPGVAGAEDRGRLAAATSVLGVGPSIRFLEHRGRGARDDASTAPIEGTLARLPDTARLRGLHLYTFKQATSTERRRRGRSGATPRRPSEALREGKTDGSA
jgi:hypothetical protein